MLICKMPVRLLMMDHTAVIRSNGIFPFSNGYIICANYSYAKKVRSKKCTILLSQKEIKDWRVGRDGVDPSRDLCKVLIQSIVDGKFTL